MAVASGLSVSALLNLPFSSLREWFLFRTPLRTALVLFCCELLLSSLIVCFARYTEIDWQAYMEEVTGWFEDGETDYTKLAGGTGPLVYPAGFVYIYTGLYWTCGSTGVMCAQKSFVILHAIQAGLVGSILWMSSLGSLPIWLIPMSFLSYRVHSIFVLRLFNDCFAVVFQYMSIWCLIRYFFIKVKHHHRIHHHNDHNSDDHLFVCILNVPILLWLSALFHSLAVSVKMNILLWAPGMAIVWYYHCTFSFDDDTHHHASSSFIQSFSLKSSHFQRVLILILFCGIIQLLLGLPFLMNHPKSYLIRAFNFAKPFEFKWSVNFQFLDESMFSDIRFGLTLLMIMVMVLMICIINLWTKPVIHSILIMKPTKKNKSRNDNNNAAETIKEKEKEVGLRVLDILMVSHLIGIVFAKSLHYQFYVWYSHSVALILYRSALSPFLSWIVLIGLEIVWNVYPPHPYASIVLHCLHAIILCSALWFQFGYVSKLDQKRLKSV